MAFRDHFSGHAAAYAEARPTYPPGLFDWLAGVAPGRDLAWDAGCGNGQASRGLAEQFALVHASDPSAEQIASAAPHPRIHFAVEPAEQCSLADHGADLVTVAQAYHWFDHPRFCAEARRVLRPGGVVAVWSYARSTVMPEVDRLFDELHDVRLQADWPAGREHVLDHYSRLPFPFERLEPPPLAMQADWNLEQYLAYLRSWSASQRHLRRTGSDAVDEIRPAMRRAWGDPEAVRVVRWPLTLLAGRS